MLRYGPLINSLNGEPEEDDLEVEIDRLGWFGEAVSEYNSLPDDMQWNVTKWVIAIPS
jgi:hypothetical protein